jgi:hypothetical protein
MPTSYPSVRPKHLELSVLTIHPINIFRVFCVTCGIVITKADIFPTVAARGAGQIVLNITIPCLMFSKIVPAFSPDNVHALGMSLVIFITLQSNPILRSSRAYRPLV